MAVLEDRTAQIGNLSRSDCWHCVTGGIFDPPPVGNEFYGRADDTANRIRAVVYRAVSGGWITHHIRLDGEKMSIKELYLNWKTKKAGEAMIASTQVGRTRAEKAKLIKSSLRLLYGDNEKLARLYKYLEGVK